MTLQATIYCPSCRHGVVNINYTRQDIIMKVYPDSYPKRIHCENCEKDFKFKSGKGWKEMKKTIIA